VLHERDGKRDEPLAADVVVAVEIWSARWLPSEPSGQMGEGSKSATIASARLHGITADSSFTARNLHGDIVRLLGDPVGMSDR